VRIVRDCDGVIAVIDLVRGIISTEEFGERRLKIIRKALAEQLSPFIRALELSIRNSKKKNKKFPLFLLFTKSDIHQLSRQELSELFKEVFAITLAQLERLNLKVIVRIHTVQSMGFGNNSPNSELLEKSTSGYGGMLADLYFWQNKLRSK
jgi:hypothetical protein